MVLVLTDLFSCSCFIIIHFFITKHNGKPLHDREGLVRQSLENISKASLDVSGCPSLGIFGGLWRSFGVFGGL